MGQTDLAKSNKNKEDVTMIDQNTNKQSGQGRQGSGNFPLDNLTYNLVTVLYEKSKGLEAYEKYLNDAQGDPQVRQLFEQMRQQDEQFVQQLQQQLGLRSGQQGQQRQSA
jgi:bacterioferritin (cytochrome b1)